MRNVRVLVLGLLTLAIAAAGWSSAQPPTADKGKDAKVDGKKEHAPHGKGPNGGVVFDLGKYHAEFTVDHGKKECMIVVLGTDEKTVTPVAAKNMTVTTKASKTKEGLAVAPMTIKMLAKDEANGKSSKYVGTDPGLGNVADFEGTVIALIDGRPSQGTFKEE